MLRNRLYILVRVLCFAGFNVTAPISFLIRTVIKIHDVLFRIGRSHLMSGRNLCICIPQPITNVVKHRIPVLILTGMYAPPAPQPSLQPSLLQKLGLCQGGHLHLRFLLLKSGIAAHSLLRKRDYHVTGVMVKVELSVILLLPGRYSVAVIIGSNERLLAHLSHF